MTALRAARSAESQPQSTSRQKVWRSVWHTVLGSVALGLSTLVGIWLHADAAVAGLLYLCIIVLTALWAGLAATLVLSFLAILGLDYFFLPPFFAVNVSEVDFIALAVFLTTAVVITQLMSRVRTSFEDIEALQRRLRLVVDTIPALTWSALPDGSTDFISQRWREYTGSDPEPGTGWGWAEIIHPDDRAALEPGWNAAVLRGEPFEGEARVRRADGQYRWFLLRAVPLRDDTHTIGTWYGTAVDIDDRKVAEESARRSASMLREQTNLLDLTHDTIFVRDRNDVITYWNRGAEALYGWTRDEAVGRVTHELLHTVFPAPLEQVTATLLRSGRWEGELIHTRRDGTHVTVASRWSLQRDDTGRPAATLETNNDITERKLGDDLVRRQANLLDQTHDAIIVWEFKGAVVFWNRAAAQLYGFSAAEAVGRASHELLHTEHPLGAAEFDAALERQGEWSGELTHLTRDGRRLLVESRHVLMREPDGRRLVLETNRDITERRQAEEAARKAQAELAHVARVNTLGEMAASIAHEVDQPLSGVVLNATASLRFLNAASPNLDEVRDGLLAIARDGRRASEVIGRIRALARRTPLEAELLDMNDVVREVVALAEGETRRTRARLRTELTASLPRVRGDRIQLQQVVLNLLLNGLEAMSHVVDRPRDLVITTQKDAIDRVRVTVQDSGVGIDPQLTNRLFDAFYTTKRGGMGMGLSISRSIIEQHGGRLWAVPNEGPGATFHFTV